MRSEHTYPGQWAATFISAREAVGGLALYSRAIQPWMQKEGGKRKTTVHSLHSQLSLPPHPTHLSYQFRELTRWPFCPPPNRSSNFYPMPPHPNTQLFLLKSELWSESASVSRYLINTPHMTGHHLNNGHLLTNQIWKSIIFLTHDKQ